MSDPPSSLRGFLAELRRRRVFRVAIVYVVAGLVVVEAARRAIEALSPDT